MTDEQLTRIFGSLQTSDDPNPAFADALFARLEREVAPPRIDRRTRPMWALIAAALLLAALLGMALAVGSGLLKLPVVVDLPPASPTASASPTAAPTPTSSESLSAAYRARAQTILDAWAGSSRDLVVLSDTTFPGAGWPPDNMPWAKEAVLSGNVVAAGPLSTETPAPGEVRWNDGASRPMPLVSAAQALENLRTSAVTPCVGPCQPLVVDQAILASMTVSTTRGEATVPAWSFHVQGSTASVLRIAVDTGAAPPPGNVVPDDRSLTFVDAATGTADSRDLMVRFGGAGAPGDQPCGADYAALAFESDSAVVIFVYVTREAPPPPGADGCLAMDYGRTEHITLAAPLGDRMVFDARRGQPVPVTGS